MQTENKSTEATETPDVQNPWIPAEDFTSVEEAQLKAKKPNQWPFASEATLFGKPLVFHPEKETNRIIELGSLSLIWVIFKQGQYIYVLPNNTGHEVWKGLIDSKERCLIELQQSIANDNYKFSVTSPVGVEFTFGTKTVLLHKVGFEEEMAVHSHYLIHHHKTKIIKKAMKNRADLGEKMILEALNETLKKLRTAGKSSSDSDSN